MSTKRKQRSGDDDDDESPEKIEVTNVYVVTVTRFCDDDKCRYEDCTDVDAVRVFTTRAKAQQYERRMMKHCVTEWQEDDSENDEDAVASDDESTIETMFKRYNEGKFVPRSYAIQIWNQEVDSDK